MTGTWNTQRVNKWFNRCGMPGAAARLLAKEVWSSGKCRFEMFHPVGAGYGVPAGWRGGFFS
jgi:hypothetical protein